MTMKTTTTKKFDAYEELLRRLRVDVEPIYIPGCFKVISDTPEWI